MAVMSSHQLEGALLEQKIHPKMASDGEQKVNGVNGHPSPHDIVPDVSSPPPDLSATPTASAVAVGNEATDAPDDATATTDPADPSTPSDAVKTADTPKPNGNCTQKEATKDKSSPAKEPTPAPDSAMDIDVKEEQKQKAEAENKPEPESQSIEPDSEDTAMQDVGVRPAAKKSLPRDGDVDMEDVAESKSEPAQSQELISSEQVVPESTQDTSVMGDREPQIKSPLDATMAGAEDETSIPPTAQDERLKSPVKVAREREDDDMTDAPALKRQRTESQPLATVESPKPLSPTSLPMDSTSSPAPAPLVESAPVGEANAEPAAPAEPTQPADFKEFHDPVRDTQPLTAPMIKEIKKAIAGIKKTKMGKTLCAPVSTTWPELWDTYRALVNKPMDFCTLETIAKEGKYPSLRSFKDDLNLIYLNACTFNGVDHSVSAQAKGYVERVYNAIKQMNHHEDHRVQRKETKPPTQASRHVEPRAATHKPRRESLVAPPPTASPAPPPKTTDESPTFAVTPSGMPLIRRDSTKNDGKRQIHPPKSKDLEYSNKGQKKKLSLELRFYEDMMSKLMHEKNSALNGAFIVPVDPVALNIPTYFQVIKKPMDLTTVYGKLESGAYKKGKELEADILLMFKNCYKFNPPGNYIHDVGKQFEELYKDILSEKDAWMKKNAPPPAPPKPARVAAPASDSDSEESEAEPEPTAQDNKARAKLEQQIKTLDTRVKEEAQKITKELAKGEPDEAILSVSQTISNTLQMQLLQAKKQLSEAKRTSTANKAKAAKSKPSKPMSATHKKVPAASKKSSGGGSKKAAPKRRPEATELQRDVVTDGILQLEEADMNRCIDIIKKDTHQTENDSGELELDITVLSSDAVWKLYDIINTKLPAVANTHKAKEPPARQQSSPEPAASRPAAVAKAARPKKNKPMNKLEQERKIEQLRELRAQFNRQSSGSQEPLPPGIDEEQADDSASSEEEVSDSEEE